MCKGTTLFYLLSIFSTPVFADCEPISSEPQLLSSEKLNGQQLQQLSTEIDVYIENLAKSLQCQQDEQNELDMQDANQKQQFEDYSMVIQNIMDKQTIAIDKYNKLFKQANLPDVNQ